MSEYVVAGRAARELGLGAREFELAVQIGAVPTVPGPERWERRVPRAVLDTLRAAGDSPGGLRERLRTVSAQEAARLLGISQGRFVRLARAGCLTPVRFRINRYRAVVWLYLVDELSRFGEDRPDLLSGRLPAALRTTVDEGADFRPRHWRTRRVAQLTGQARGPWERAAARAAVLAAEVRAEAVPDPAERTLLAALAPELTTSRSESAATAEVVRTVCTASDEDEVLWHRLLLAAELEEARGHVATGPVPARQRPDAARAAADAAARSRAEPRPLVRSGESVRRATRLRRILARASAAGRRGPVSPPAS
ncbi:DUF6397 family protein [Streptomyces sp. Z26]|uniref:DUF6397 family protein n=1 Tax=Streptomyces TaxID=1883 RepID=UPI000EF167BB|nr:DUF6397 family protein [Streptomyces sp. Z26]RLL69903.1 hypothetical protein D7M15_27345 [Streptomyces sp. Z26]